MTRQRAQRLAMQWATVLTQMDIPDELRDVSLPRPRRDNRLTIRQNAPQSGERRLVRPRERDEASGAPGNG